jgi:hypothetical protein
MRKTDLTPPDFDHLEESIRKRLAIEIMHNMGMINDKTYFQKYSTNAEELDRDYQLWQELQDIDQ